MVRTYGPSRMWKGKKTLTVQFKSGYGYYHDKKHKFEKEKERFIASRADCFVFASGYLILDTQTGIWRRYSYPVRDRMLELCKKLNQTDRQQKSLTAKLDSDNWPEGIVQKLREINHILANWYKIPARKI